MLKIALFLLAVFVLLWLLRGGTSRRTPPPGGPAGGPGPTPQPMLACAQCGVHLPRDEALPGRGGIFCGEPHRAAYEREHGQG
jgi:uncharacterized protein